MNSVCVIVSYAVFSWVPCFYVSIPFLAFFLSPSWLPFPSATSLPSTNIIPSSAMSCNRLLPTNRPSISLYRFTTSWFTPSWIFDKYTHSGATATLNSVCVRIFLGLHHFRLSALTFEMRQVDTMGSGTNPLSVRHFIACRIDLSSRSARDEFFNSHRVHYSFGALRPNAVRTYAEIVGKKKQKSNEEDTERPKWKYLFDYVGCVVC